MEEGKIDINKIHMLLYSKLEKRDKIEKEPFKLVTKCCGCGGEANETAELSGEIDKLKQENIDIVKDYHKISVKLSNVEQEKIAVEQELEQTKNMVKLKQEEVSVLQTKNDEVLKDIQSKIEMINVIRQESSAHQINRIRLEDDLKRLNIENHRIMDEYAKLEQELRVTKELYSKIQTNPSITQQPQGNNPPTQSYLSSNATTSSFQVNGMNVSASKLPTECKRQITGHSSDILCFRYNSNGTVLASASADKTVKLWDVATGKIKSSVGGVLQSFTHLSFSPMGDMLLATSNDSTAKVWYLANSRLRHSLTGHSGKVTCGEFFDTDKIMTGSHDRTLKTWDVNKGYCLKTTVCFSSCNCMMMGGMGNLVLTGHCDNTIRFWDIRSKECIDINKNIHTSSVSDIINVLDGRYFVSIGKDNIIQYVDGVERKVISSFSHPDFTVTSSSRMCCSPDGKYIIAGSSNGEVFCWDTQSKKLETVLKPKLTQPTKAGCYAVSWNPVQSQIVSGHANKIVIWEN
ncbi:WD domain, G-beta repeat containing protein [Entamoeba histolytica HM-1:IMSS-B]|uniref:WD domain containing protein n=6 Tax=Entamoeba histolytica TaxID=5759 RepID=C4M4P7_ENTH1|nr:WD domain containing protein [Entamoeba histolytica HM-1:IMSS]EMH77994.1 WD domain, G-beta repeat containing protein [Entamoeba histolytica HM-1:IMSS-B]EMS12796.1 protein tipD, putative [Entamoeba histolytica HM-3:IMSS]ENY64121.1 protein tipD, putative [Entamoeba histolytica HM-1:IMSS-A]GAT96368.1 WD domain containing protein [Entamoeba histolytica]EAL45537.1 WD domain containing protein [Entamoeba histolytica HM-1:IMSS]|eukprot:XP_650923.1 WD domain containing protein [Entamoeba histolytica HM-1:IMSS]